MVEVAAGMFQCPLCGLGTTARGFHPVWAIHDLSKEPDSRYYALCVRYQEGTYSLSELLWKAGPKGRVGPLTEELLISTLTAKQIREFPLPVVLRTPEPHKIDPLSVLTEEMYLSARGPKEIDL